MHCERHTASTSNRKFQQREENFHYEPAVCSQVFICSAFSNAHQPHVSLRHHLPPPSACQLPSTMPCDRVYSKFLSVLNSRNENVNVEQNLTLNPKLLGACDELQLKNESPKHTSTEYPKHDSKQIGADKTPTSLQACFGGSPFKKRMQLVNVRHFVCVCVCVCFQRYKNTKIDFIYR
jgi:hypothetical protein